MVRIALIHALAHSVAPINEAFQRDWPQAQRMNLLDDSLSSDWAAGFACGEGDARKVMQQRFLLLAQYAVDCGAAGILFTCSAFGPCIDAVARQHAGLPVMKPNEAMVTEAVQAAAGGRIGLIASFEPTLRSMPAEFPRTAALELAFANGALAALNAGDVARHDRLIADAARTLHGRGCAVIALAQFSMARAQAVCEAAVGGAVLTTLDSAVHHMRKRCATPTGR
jgi:hypothetical protein